MSNNKKVPAVLYISTDVKNAIEKIEKNHYLDLHNSMTTRIELFLFAMALGLETVPSELHQKESFVRTEYIRVRDEALMHSVFINELGKNEDIEDCVIKNKVYELAQKYTNTGLKLIGDMIDTKPESVALLELVAELDQEYEKLFK